MDGIFLIYIYENTWEDKLWKNNKSWTVSQIKTTLKINKMCLWNTNDPDNGQFQIWSRSRSQGKK